MKTKEEVKHESLLAVESWYLGKTQWNELDSKLDSLLEEYRVWIIISYDSSTSSTKREEP
jgi:hypothetical protein